MRVICNSNVAFEVNTNGSDNTNNNLTTIWTLNLDTTGIHA